MNDAADQSLKSIASAARHDLKQSLHVVSLYLQLAQQQLADDHPVAEALGRAMGALEQQRTLTQRLRQVAEVPGPLKGRSEVMGAISRVVEAVPSVRVEGDVGGRHVPVPGSRLEQLLGHVVAAAGTEGDGLTLRVDDDDEVVVVVVTGQRAAASDPTWTDGDHDAEHWLALRLADVVGADLMVSRDDRGTHWRLTLP